MKSKIFFTLPHNNPSGGVKVVNEFVNLCNERGFESFLCLPTKELKKAFFLEFPSPILSLEEMLKTSSEIDYIVCCWQSKIEFKYISKAKAKRKVFWQHGILIPNTSVDVGEEVYKSGLFDAFANVSLSCAGYIKDKYNLPEVLVINPFFDIKTDYLIDRKEKKGFLLLARRGSEYIPIISKYLKQNKESLTILHEPYKSSHFINLLKIHKFFISIDNGLKYNLPLVKKLIGKKLSWIKHDKNYLGFPVPAVEAAQCRTLVIGYAMGGGLEWMNNENIFLAKDDDVNSLLEQIQYALNSNNDLLDKISKVAYLNTIKFNKENSWQQLKKILGI